MATNEKIVIAFDLYGTLLSTESIATELAKHFGEEKAKEVAALWRRFQLEYTWRLNSMALYKPFSDITQASLHHALGESNVSLSDANIASLMKAYDTLDTFPDVQAALKTIANNPSIEAYIFSNGTDAMVSSSVNASPSLSPHSSVFKGLITVEETRTYKPNPKTYHHLAEKAGKKRTKEDLKTIWLVSGNPFDVTGAKAAGLQAAWVDRAGGHHGGGGWNDRLGELANGGPTIIVQDVNKAVQEIVKWVVQR